MSAKRASLTMGLSMALAFAGPYASAQARHGGGGGHPGGGHAVPRGGPSVGHPGGGRPGGGHPGGAPGRHPSPGHGGYGYNHGYHGGHYYGRGYYPYYRGYYGGYYGYYGYPYASFYYGWPSYSYWPYASASYYYSAPGYYPPYVAGTTYDDREAPPPSDSPRYYADSDRPRSSASAYGTGSDDSGRLRIEVRPDDAAVYVDDEFWDYARDRKFIVLRSGTHSVELVRPGFVTTRRDVQVVRGQTTDVLVELQRP